MTAEKPIESDYEPGYRLTDEIWPAFPMQVWPKWAQKMAREQMKSGRYTNLDRELVAEMRRRQREAEK
jgi:hypothetical protein